MSADANRLARPGVGPRPCMTCKQAFLSEGYHNRMCDSCRALSTGPEAPPIWALVPEREADMNSDYE